MKKLFSTLCALLLVFFGVQSRIQAVGVNDGTGSITITNAQSGIEYSVYQIFSASYSENNASGTNKGVTYFATEADKNFFEGLSMNGLKTSPFVFTPAGTDNYEVTIRSGYPSDTVIQFFDQYSDEIEQHYAASKYTPTSVSGHSVVFSNIPYGYYYVFSSSGAAVTLTSAVPNAQVIEKNQRPEIDENAKKVQEGDDWVSWSGTSVGDIRNFRIQYSASNYINETIIRNYTLTDRTNNLEIDPDTIELTIGDTVIPVASFAGDKITMTNQDGVLTVNIPWVDENGDPLYRPAPTIVTLTYQAKVLPDAALHGAGNTVEISYEGHSAYSTVYLATYSFQLNKYDKTSYENGSPITLNGARFTLWDSAENGNQIYVTANGTGGYNVLGTGKENANDTLIEAGMTTIYGLNSGIYYLQEETAPDGYNRLASRVAVTIEKPSASSQENIVNVLNAKGSMLPSTGENGNFMIYAASLILSGLAILLIFVRRNQIHKGR